MVVASSGREASFHWLRGVVSQLACYAQAGAQGRDMRMRLPRSSAKAARPG